MMITMVQPTGENLDALLSKSREIFEEYPLDVVYLFGSQISPAQTHAGSDYDFAVLFSDEVDRSQRSLMRGEIMDRLFSVFGRDQVDIIDLEASPLTLQFEAIQPCEIILCNNNERRVQFETRVSRKYHDMKPYFDRELKSLTEQLGSG